MDSPFDANELARLQLEVESSNAPFIYSVQCGDRMVVATLERIWVITCGPDRKMTEISRADRVD